MLCAAVISVDSSSNAQNSSGTRAHVLRAVDLRGGIELLLALNPLFETVIWSIAPPYQPKTAGIEKHTAYGLAPPSGTDVSIAVQPHH